MSSKRDFNALSQKIGVKTNLLKTVIYAQLKAVYLGMPLGAFLLSRLNRTMDDPDDNPPVLVWGV